MSRIFFQLKNKAKRANAFLINPFNANGFFSMPFENFDFSCFQEV